MSKKYSGAVMAGVFILLGLVMFFSSFGMKSLAQAQVGPAFVPRIIAVCMICLGGAQLFLELKAAKTVTQEPTAEVELDEDGLPKPFLKRHGFALTLALVFAYILLMPKTGFILATIGYLFCQICIFSHTLAPKKLLGYGLLAAVTAVIIYLLFVRVFGMILPAGILG